MLYLYQYACEKFSRQVWVFVKKAAGLLFGSWRSTSCTRGFFSSLKYIHFKKHLKHVILQTIIKSEEKKYAPLFEVTVFIYDCEVIYEVTYMTSYMWLHIWSHIWRHICDFIIYEVTVIYNVFKRDLKSADYLFCYLFIYLNDYYCYYYTKYLLNMAMTDFKNNFTTLKSCKVVFCNSNVRPLFHTSPHGYLCFLMMLFLHI